MKSLVSLHVALLCTVPAFAALDEIELKDWTLQDATVVEAQAKKEGWFKYNSANQTTEGEKLSLNGYDAKIVGKNTVELAVPGGMTPTRVRYAWSPDPDVNLVNSADLPATPFEMSL